MYDGNPAKSIFVRASLRGVRVSEGLSYQESTTLKKQLVIVTCSYEMYMHFSVMYVKLCSLSNAFSSVMYFCSPHLAVTSSKAKDYSVQNAHIFSFFPITISCNKYFSFYIYLIITL